MDTTRFTPENITALKENEVFCYGANFAGVHGAGAAKLAYQKFGAKYGQIGFCGKSYGLATKDENINTLSLNKIKEEIIKYVNFAKTRPDLIFLTTKVGTGLGGIHYEDIAELFFQIQNEVGISDNVILPEEFVNYMDSKNMDFWANYLENQ